MPRLCEFYGITIFMYFVDHDPPHFHAFYGEHQASVTIDGFRLLDGHLPVRALTLVRTWGKIHRQELKNNWVLARTGRRPEPIAPLE